MEIGRADILRRGPGRPAGDGLVRQFILKIHSRCDLNCDYCYVYSMSDQSWRGQPRSMAPGTVAQTARRIGEYVSRHGIGSVDVVLHGGEPLLAGPELIESVVRTVRGAAGDGCRTRFSVQTNGLRLDAAFLDLFDRLDVGVGVSLDGDAAVHDTHRRRPDGRGSHAAVRAALERLCGSGRRHLFDGLLCTIDVRTDPVRVYESLLVYEPPAVDFLLPHGSWASPPPGVRIENDRRVREDGSALTAGQSAVPYARWLGAVFDRWYTAPRLETRVRLLEEIVNLLLGGSSAAEDIGGAPPGSLVVATDGTILSSDAVSAVRPQPSAQPACPPTVWDTGFDAFLRLPPVHAARTAHTHLCRECRACPVRRACGGGLYAHRYREGNGFDNPSVYCADLYQLIDHIRGRLHHDVADLRSTAR